MPTLLRDLDSALAGGLRRQELLILVADDGATVSALRSKIPFNIAADYEPEVVDDGTFVTRAGGVVAYFSTKLSAETLATAIISAQTGISVEEIERGNITEEKFETLVQCSQMMQKVPLFIRETPRLTMDSLRVAALRVMYTRGLDVIFIDDLADVEGSSDNLEDELLKLAKDLDVAVVCVSTVQTTVVSDPGEADAKVFRIARRVDTTFTETRLDLTPIQSDRDLESSKTRDKAQFLRRALEVSDLTLSGEQLSPQATPLAIARLLGGPVSMGRKVETSADLARLVQDGLPVAALDQLLDLGFSNTEIEALISAKRTLSRRRSVGRLTPAEGDTVIRLAKTYLLAMSAIGSESSALRWLRRKRKDSLGGRAPIELLETEVGGDVVEEILLQVIYGVAS